MGKLNYTNRKISGDKLGSVVKKDILRHSQSLSKPRSTKDPHLEINLQGKELSDEGFQLVCEGLREAYEVGLMKLDELHLAENKITMKGLKALCEIIPLASKDLKDLDLRANALAVANQAEADIWEQFLESFQDVCCLRRLDVADNAIGDRGFEIFWRVYSKAQSVHIPGLLKVDSSDDDLDTDGTEIMRAETLEMESLQMRTRKMGLNGGRRSSAAAALVTPPRPRLGTRFNKGSLFHTPDVSDGFGAADLRGLRSIPYFIFNNTGATDCAVLFLSYILPVHATPELLMPYFSPPKLGNQADILDAYYTTNCRGIVYRPNDKLSLFSQRLLECAEAKREGKTLKIMETETNPYTGKVQLRRNSDANLSLHSAPNLREKVAWVLTPKNPVSSAPELERARSKIQGVILRESGPHSVALWAAALRMLVLARLITFDPNAGPYEGQHRLSRRRDITPVFGSASSVTTFASQHGGHSPPVTPTRGPANVLECPATDTQNWPSMGSGHPTRPHYQDRFTPPVWGLSAAARFPKLELELATIPDAEELVVPKLTKSGEAPPSPAPSEGFVAIGFDLPGNLPENLWRNIIAMAADPDELLSTKQQRNVFNWAKTRDTLERERELIGKLRSLQIWRVLDGMECLAYEGL